MSIKESSIGETVDRYSILKVKQQKLKDPIKLQEIDKELSTLQQYKQHIDTCCKIEISDYDTMLKKIPEINYLSIEYDSIVIDEPYRKLFSNTIPQKENVTITHTINISDITLEDNEREIYDFDPISYVSSGAFGDFIHQLSIINEKFYESGRKGILYIYVTDDTIPSCPQHWHITKSRKSRKSRKSPLCLFRKGIVSTYNDTFEGIKNQPYIKDYKIWNQEPFDIDLTGWRSRPDIYDTHTWSETFKIIYNVKWGNKPWINVPIDKKWEKIVFVYTVAYRDPVNIDYNKICSQYGESIMFITNNPQDAEFFNNKYHLNVPVYVPNNFTETCIAIRSCKLFVGTLSGLLTIAHACHIPHIVGLCDDNRANMRVSDIDKIFPNVQIGTN